MLSRILYKYQLKIHLRRSFLLYTSFKSFPWHWPLLGFMICNHIWMCPSIIPTCSFPSLIIPSHSFDRTFILPVISVLSCTTLVKSTISYSSVFLTPSYNCVQSLFLTIAWDGGGSTITSYIGVVFDISPIPLLTLHMISKTILYILYVQNL